MFGTIGLTLLSNRLAQITITVLFVKIILVKFYETKCSPKYVLKYIYVLSFNIISLMHIYIYIYIYSEYRNLLKKKNNLLFINKYRNQQIQNMVDQTFTNYQFPLPTIYLALFALNCKLIMHRSL